ncbi:pilus assembly protein [Glycomyces albus]
MTATMRRRHRRTGVRDRGSISIEAAWGMFILIILIGVAVAAMRISTVDASVNTAAHSAARAASLQLDPADARAAAEFEAEAMLPDSCTDPVVTVDITDFTPGGTVTAAITCTVDPLMGEPRVITHTAAAPIDQWRSGGDD